MRLDTRANSLRALFVRKAAAVESPESQMWERVAQACQREDRQSHLSADAVSDSFRAIARANAVLGRWGSGSRARR